MLFMIPRFVSLGILNDSSVNRFASLGGTNPTITQISTPDYDPVGTGKTVVISLSSPASDGGGELEGAEDFLVSDEKDKSVSHSLVESGDTAKPQLGRIDADWGISRSEVSPAKSDEQQSGNNAGEEDANPDEVTLLSTQPAHRWRR